MIVIGHAHSVFPSKLAMLIPLNQGVSFFFVLSGFILTWNYPVLSDWGARRNFWLARVARIWPLHLVTCLLWIVLMFESGSRVVYLLEGGGLAKLIINLMLLQVWVPLHDWAVSFNGVSWSISAEFFFYAMFPLLIIYWARHWHYLLAGQAVVVTIFIAIGVYFSLPAANDYPGVGLFTIIYLNPLTRVLEFTIGIALCNYIRQAAANGIKLTSSQWLVLELLVLIGITIALLAASRFYGSIAQTFSEPIAYYFAFQGVWLFWALLIGVFALSRGPVARLLSQRIFVFLGEISFALYLCHAMLIHYLEHYKEQIYPFATWGYVVFWLWALSFAALLYTGVEVPCRQFILQVVKQKNWTASMRTYFRTREIIALLMLTFMVGSMHFLRPSTILRLDENEVNAFLSDFPEEVVVLQGVSFAQRYGIIAVRSRAIDANTQEVRVLLRALRSMHINDKLALHLNDSSGKMLRNFDKLIDVGRLAIPSGTQWIQVFQVPRSAIKEATSMGLAMYNSPKALFNGEGGERDWDGKRLILPLTR